MPALLLPVIYLAFISLGLPDSALGSAWPSMYEGLDAGVSWVGAVTAIIAAGTIISSVMSVRVVERFGTGRTTAVSVALTAAGLLGFSSCGEFWQLCLWAVPYGLGAGAVDAALNSYVAVHYASRHMSWLHCMWGVGASGGPVIMSWCLGWGTWSTGFCAIGAIQVAIAAVLTLSLPLWARAEQAAAAGGAVGAGPSGPAPEGASAELSMAANPVQAADPSPIASTGPAFAQDSAAALAEPGPDPVSEATSASGADVLADGVSTSDVAVPTPAAPVPSRRALLAIPGVFEVLVCFFCYSALEATCGTWAASYCTLVRGIPAGQAAAWASLFYAGITMGRAASGFLTLRFSDTQLIRLGQAVIGCGIVLLLVPGPRVATMAGLACVGLGCAPIYPSIIHATPARFGASNALALTGLQMAAAYTGTLAMSPLFGALAEALSPALYPLYLAVLLVLMVIMAERCNAKVAARR